MSLTEVRTAPQQTSVQTSEVFLVVKPCEALTADGGVVDASKEVVTTTAKLKGSDVIAAVAQLYRMGNAFVVYNMNTGAVVTPEHVVDMPTIIRRDEMAVSAETLLHAIVWPLPPLSSSGKRAAPGASTSTVSTASSKVQKKANTPPPDKPASQDALLNLLQPYPRRPHPRRLYGAVEMECVLATGERVKLPYNADLRAFEVPPDVKIKPGDATASLEVIDSQSGAVLDTINLYTRSVTSTFAAAGPGKFSCDTFTINVKSGFLSSVQITNLDKMQATGSEDTLTPFLRALVVKEIKEVRSRKPKAPVSDLALLVGLAVKKTATEYVEKLADLEVRRLLSIVKRIHTGTSAATTAPAAPTTASVVSVPLARPSTSVASVPLARPSTSVVNPPSTPALPAA